jgi:two-component sensor histidine kinase
MFKIIGSPWHASHANALVMEPSLHAKGDGMMNVRPETGEDQGYRSELGDLQARLAEVRRELAQVEHERQASRDREALLANELQHRVRNMLAIIRTIFSRTIASGGSLEDVADHFRGRLDAVARYQNFQSLDPGGTIDFELIVRDELNTFQFGDDQRIRIAGPEARLASEAAQAVGLALHELVTNSIKFGALAGIDERSRLDISWRESETQLCFVWQETGVSVLSSAPLHRGFGRAFIEEAMPYQIGAETQFELRPGGIFCAITVPLDAIEGRTGPVAYS